MMDQRWAPGDRVVHATKPEWGQGDVLEATATQHEGKACQRVTVRFARVGLKTVLTAIAELRPAQDGGGGWLSDLEAGNPGDRLTAIPDACTDPFRSLESRLEATARLYRFQPSGASLVEWAAIQSGMDDPLVRFTRHDLERYFDQFRIVLDNHLRKLLAEASRKDPAMISRVARTAPPAAQAMLRREHARR